MKFAFFTCIISAFLFTKAFAVNMDTVPNNLQQPDSIDLRNFKTYLNTFIRAVRAKDTSFIKAHTIFPITNSTVSSRSMDQRHFIKHLADFFPKDLVKRIEKEGRIVVIKPAKNGKDFIVTVYDTTQGTDANYSWMFTRKQNDFYFVTFRAEIG